MTAYTARALTTDKLQRVITQTLHGFTVGNILRFDGSSYVLAQADSFSNSEAIGMVLDVLSPNEFILTQVGYITGLPGTIVEGSPLVAGGYYYLSTTQPGGLTATMTTTDYQVVLACFIADSTSSGYFMANDGIENTPGGGGGFTWNVANINTGMSVDNGYIINGLGTLTMTLPATANTGNIIEIAGYANGWILQLNPGQTVHFGNMDTSSGGTIASNYAFDAIRIICVVATTDWLVLSADGNLTVT